MSKYKEGDKFIIEIEAETFADYIEEVKKLAYESGIEKGRAEEWNKMSVENAKQTERADALLEASENLAEKLVEKDEQIKSLFDENEELRARVLDLQTANSSLYETNAELRVRLAKVQEVAKGEQDD